VNGAAVTLNIGILLGLAGLDVFQPNALVLSSFHQLSTDVFGAIINSNSVWFPLAALVNMSLSNVRSDIARRGRWFSFSSSFRRLS